MTQIVEYIFGHSLVNYDDSDLSTDDRFTSVPYWMGLFAEASGEHAYSFTGQYGFYPTVDNIIGHWGFVGQASPWEGDFAASDFTHVTFTMANFIQDRGIDEESYLDGMVPSEMIADALRDLAALEPGLTVTMYDAWPRLSRFVETPEDATAQDWQDYLDWLRGDYAAWWDALYDVMEATVAAEGLDLTIQRSNVSGMLADMLSDPALGLSQEPLTTWFVDGGPHGTASLYYLASMIHYASVYGTLPPGGIDTEGTVDAVVLDNLDALNGYLSDALDLDTDDGLPGAILGTAGADLLEGTASDDLMQAGAGDDTLEGSAGADTLDGGEGWDFVRYDSGADLIDLTDMSRSTGDAAGDVLTGIESLRTGGGDDTIIMSEDLRKVSGEGGWDRIIDSTGLDSMSGGAGHDTFVMSTRDGQRDVIEDFEAGADRIDLTAWGTSWAELHLEQDGTDVVIHGPGDSLRLLDVTVAQLSEDDFLGLGRDASSRPTDGWWDVPAQDVLLVAGAAAEQLQGGSGQDTVLFDGGADLIDLTDMSRSTGTAANDSLSGIEVVAAGNGDDTIFLGQDVHHAQGGSGWDRLVDGAGADTLEGGWGTDVFVMSALDGAEDLILDFDDEIIDLGAWQVSFADLTLAQDGADVLISVDGDSLRLSNTDVTGLTEAHFRGLLTGDTGTTSGSSGNDLLVATSVTEALLGGAGIDTVVFDSGADLIDLTDMSQSTGTAANDSLSGIEAVAAGNGDDTIRLGGDVHHAMGDGGWDKLYDGAGADTLEGGWGTDTFFMTARDGFEDVILDFDAETIDLSGWAASVDELTLLQDGADAVILVSGDSLRVIGTQISDLSGDALRGLLDADDAVVVVPPDSSDATGPGTEAPDPEPAQPDPDLPVVQGTDGDDTLSATDLVEAIMGGAGTDTLVFGTGSELIDLSDMSQSTGSASGDVLDDIEVVNGGSGADTIILSDDIHVAEGSHDADVLVDGSGADTLVGGFGRDTFVFAARDGHEDVIADFADDTIDLTGWHVAFADLTITQDGGDVVILVEGDSLRIATYWEGIVTEDIFSGLLG